MTQVDGGGVPAGTQLNGIYEIERRIAMGGMGEVYVGKLIQTGDRVAIKMILPEHANNEIIVDLFRKEASTLHNLYHEAIVRYYVFSVDPELNRPYLAMEFAGGPAISDRLQEGKPFAEDEMDVLRRRVAGGLHAAHKLGIIHRDISPDNVILVDGDVEKAKIIDFGIAKSTASEGTLIGSGFAGKLNYVSPEQLGLAGGEVTAKSDIYALGLVFAEAVIGRPLPMGGSQVEVLDKRRTVPDLSDVPAWIRPLIEAMVQPDPNNRPADMEAVANWSAANAPPSPAAVAAASTGAVEAAPAGNRPVHPRERRRQQEEHKPGGSGSGGLPWLWIGAGGTGLAAIAAAAYVFLGDPTGSGGPADGSEETGGLLPGAITLNPPGVLPVPPGATEGQDYAWISAPFDYTGDPSELRFDVEGDLAPGLSITPTGDGSVTFAGVPTGDGGSFSIVASSPDGLTARQDMAIPVTPSASDSASPSDPPQIATSQTPTLLAPPDDEGSGLQAGTGDSGISTGPQPGTLGGGQDVPVLGQPQVPTVSTPGGGQTGGSGTLQPPSDDGGSGIASLSPGSDTAPTTGQPGSSTLGGTTGSVSTPTVPTTDPEPQDPGANSDEPTVETGSPGTLTTPTDGSGSTAVSGGSDGTATLPSTGGAPTEQPQAGQDNTQLSAIPKPENQPPTLQDPHQGPVSAVQGQPMNVRLGAFFDEEGPSALKLNVEGAVPSGVSIQLADGGVLQLFGSAAEFGNYEFKVAAVDPQGLVSQPVNFSLAVTQPTANSTVRDYILGYDGGACFLSRPVTLAERTAQIEVFAAEIPPAIAFDADFKRDQGFEANIGLRLISNAQCPLVNALDRVGPQALDNSLAISLTQDELTSGDRLQGKIKGGDGARLFLFDHLGGLTDLSEKLSPVAGGASFGLPIQAEGPQILIATKPRAGSGVSPDLTLEELLGAAEKGQASIALGFFIMKAPS